ncbi:MAG: Gfo/Idh/MocA family oxidoreductase [Rhizobiaceae bacterium]
MVRIAVVGAGLIGKRHAEAIASTRNVALSAIVDPVPSGKEFAAAMGAAWHGSLNSLLAQGDSDGIIVAVPNELHVPLGLECIAAGLPTLIEKPLASDISGAQALVDAAAAADVALAVGHHRRHNPLIAHAREQITSGRLGKISAVHGMFWVRKPDDYFNNAWRRGPGAGPLLINLIHDIDLLRHLVGEIIRVQAITSNTLRGHEVEDGAAIVMHFENGALGTFNLSDGVPSPWSWELASGENPAYPVGGQSCYFIGGTMASMELPSCRIWENQGSGKPGGWWDPIIASRCAVPAGEPLARQIAQFAQVIRGLETPVAPASEGLRSLMVVEAVRQSAREGAPVSLPGSDGAMNGDRTS